jgi:PKD repeat protein
LKADKDDMELRELFRSRLENAELDPDPSVNSLLMRRLARREFMMFNPGRFNIYYLGAALLAGIAATIILFSGDNSSVDLREDSVRSESTVAPGIQVTDHKDTFVANTVSVAKPDVNTPKSVSVPVERKEGSSMISKEVAGENSLLRPVDNADIIPLRSKNDLFKNEVIDSDKLITRAKGVEQFFVSSVSEGCVPLKVKFIAFGDDIDSCRWTFGDGGSSFEKAPEWIFDIEGEYKIVLEAYSSGKLIASTSSFINVHPGPVANFQISPEKAIIPDDEIRFINYSTDAVKYKWDFGDGSSSDLFEPTHKYNKFGSYNIKLTALTEYGCADSLLVLNAFSGSRYYIYFPNAFIPNPNGPSGGIYSSASDEYAHVFHPESLGVSEYQLRIFSKMGILIFESNDINIGWDGYFKGQLSNSGVYIWKVRGKYRNGEPFTKMGDVTLLKTD